MTWSIGHPRAISYGRPPGKMPSALGPLDAASKGGRNASLPVDGISGVNAENTIATSSLRGSASEKKKGPSVAQNGEVAKLRSTA